MSDHSTPSQYDPSSPGGINSRLVLVLFVTGAVLLAVILAATEAGYNYVEDGIEVEGQQRGNVELLATLDAQEARLHTRNRITGDPTRVIVPVEVAIDAFLAQHQKGTKP